MADTITIEECITLLDAIRHEIVSNSRDHFALSAGIAALYEMEKNAPAVNRWISVEDALPEIKEFNISDTVLCYCDSGALAIARLEANGFGKVGFNCEEDDGYGYYSVGKVLYWMPIPEIPEPPEKE